MTWHSRALELVIAEEARINNNSIKTNEVIREVIKYPKLQDYINEYTRIINGESTLLALTGSGRINELTIISSSSEVYLKLISDNRVIFNKSIKDFLKDSEFISTVVVTEYDNNYIFSLKNFNYANGLQLVAKTLNKTTVQVFYAYTGVVTSGSGNNSITTENPGSITG